VASDTDPLAPDRQARAARRYRALVADREAFIWVMDPKLRPTGANQAWEAYTGQSRDDYLTLGWLDAIAEPDRARCLREIERNAPLERPFGIELAIRRRDGVYRRHAIRAVPVRDEHGTVVEWIGTATDVEADRLISDREVEERRAIEADLLVTLAEHRELRARLVALTDGAEGVLREGSLAGVRRAICDLAEHVLPADAYAIWSLDVSASVWQVVHHVALPESLLAPQPGGEVAFTDPLVADELQGHLPPHREAAYRAAGIASLISVPLPIDGIRRGAVVAHYRRPHHTSEAEVQVAVALGHLAAAAISNAEARARQEAMRADAERQSRRMAFLAEVSTLLASLDFSASFRRLAELAVPSLGDWCAIDVERDGLLVRVAVAHPDPAMVVLAQKLYERFPVRRDDVVGVARVLRSGQSELHSHITDEMVAAAVQDKEHLNILQSLTIRSAILAPIMARGRTLGVLTLVSSRDDRHYDDTDLRFVEEVARRAATAIDNARLYEDAQRANRAKDEFLALLSHELRTPLNAVMGWAQILLNASTSAPLDSQHRRGLEIIRRNARLQAELVDGLLNVARVATGGLPLTLQPIDVGEATHSAIEAIRPIAVERGLQVQLAVESNGCRVLADPNRLQQVLSNLLSNALKFTHVGDRIEVGVRQREKWCEIEVTDSGTGIAPEFLPHVFERFRQADSSTTRRHGGLGLGLWLVHELVRSHGGSVTASSPGPGRGSTFVVRLPLHGG
jgi:PAS domain S-box-containing protein